MRWFICNSLWQFLVFCRRFENLQLKLTSERHQSSPWAFRSTLQFDPQIKWVDERSMSQVFHDHLETNLVRTPIMMDSDSSKLESKENRIRTNPRLCVKHSIEPKSIWYGSFRICFESNPNPLELEYSDLVHPYIQLCVSSTHFDTIQQFQEL